MSTSKEDLGYSPGLEGIVAGETVICNIDVEREDMFYRGFSIKEIAEKRHGKRLHTYCSTKKSRAQRNSRITRKPSARSVSSRAR